MKKFVEVLFLFSIINFISFIVINFLIYARDYIAYGVRLFDYRELLRMDFYFSISFLIFGIIVKLVFNFFYKYKVSFKMDKFNLRMTIEKKI